MTELIPRQQFTAAAKYHPRYKIFPDGA